METLAIVTLTITSIIGAIGIFIGINPKKLSGWLFGLSGFLCGFIFGFARAGLILGLQIGGLFAFAIMFGGIMVGSQRQHYKDVATTWISRNEKTNRWPWLVSIIKKLRHHD
jgi:hypothetical protein